MTWLEKAMRTAEEHRIQIDYVPQIPRPFVCLEVSSEGTLLLEVQVGQKTPLPLSRTLRQMNDEYCAVSLFQSIGILYSGEMRKFGEVWCYPVEMLLHDPNAILRNEFPGHCGHGKLRQEEW